VGGGGGPGKDAKKVASCVGDRSMVIDCRSDDLHVPSFVATTHSHTGFSPIQAAFAAARDNARPFIPEHAPKPLAVLIRKCWRYGRSYVFVLF
jgi:hypothetical protein